jgi:DeoR/GlpR family transcriptional regulator of sugar metabolism
MEIARILHAEKKVSVAQLAKEFYISDATIRRDLEKLEKHNLIKRTYGGAVLLGGLNSENPIEVRLKEHAEEKKVIGRLAAQFVGSSNVIIMDSSTSVLAMADYLHGVENITIITNGLQTATYIGENLHQSVYCCGGRLSDGTMALSGYCAEEFFTHYNAEKLFFSCLAVSFTGEIMDSYEDIARLKRRMIEKSDQVFLLCDSSKIGKKSFCHTASFEDINFIITDKAPNDDLMTIIERENVKAVYPE